jgi:hypothetical protein
MLQVGQMLRGAHHMPNPFGFKPHLCSPAHNGFLASARLCWVSVGVRCQRSFHVQDSRGYSYPCTYAHGHNSLVDIRCLLRSPYTLSIRDWRAAGGCLSRAWLGRAPGAGQSPSCGGGGRSGQWRHSSLLPACACSRGAGNRCPRLSLRPCGRYETVRQCASTSR